MSAVPVSSMGPGRSVSRALLDGDEPMDAAAREAVDDALRLKSADPLLHAAALWLAFSSDGDLRLDRSPSRGWIQGVHELIHSGHLDAAAYALPRLEAAFPGVPYLENMASVFRRLPPPACNDREPFVDDRDSDVQTIRTPGADTVMIAFCGGHHSLGLPVNLLDRWFARLDGHLVYLRDREKVGYTGGVPALGADMTATIEGLRGIVRDLGARHVVCVGNSAGAAGAVRYAKALEAERVLALSPISGGIEYSRKVSRHLPPGGVKWWGDLTDVFREGNGVRTHVVYGEKNSGDRQQALRLAGLPGVTVEALTGWEAHHLIHGLLHAGRLEPVLDWLVSGDDAQVRAAVRRPSRPRRGPRSRGHDLD